MFNPIYNHDGSVSVFRVICLVVISLCMLSYAVILLSSSESTQVSAPAAVADEKPAPQVEQEKPQASVVRIDPVKLRKQALNELASSIRYFEACGVLSRGYEGCHFAFSKVVTDRYEVTEDAVDDGFIISFKLKNSEEDSSCSLMSYSSSGDHLSHGADGRISDSCFPEDFLSDGSVSQLHHATDHVEGKPAPSGAIAENGRQTAQATKPQDSLTSL